jgi:type IV pilus assembly protein PilE
MGNTMRSRGFTFLELMITVAIIAILAVIASNIYLSQVQKSRRADAMDTISAITLAEERYRSTNSTYGTLAQVWASVTATPGGYYTVAITNTSATSYTVTATGVGTQASDAENGTSCSALVFAVSNGTVTTTPAVCWPQ